MRDDNFACRIHTTAQSVFMQATVGHWVSLCVSRAVGWLIVYQLGINLYPVANTVRPSVDTDDKACLGVRNTSSMGLGITPLVRCLP